MKLSRLSIALGSLAVLSGAVVVACTGDDFPSNPLTDAGADVTTDVTTDGPLGDSGPDVKPPSLQLGRMDRAGQPGVAYLLGTQADASLRSEFNENLPFSTSEKLTAAFHASLVKLDGVDNAVAWTTAGPAEGTVTQVPQDAGPDADGGFKAVRSYPHPLVGHVATNALMVDSSKPFSASGYFDVELKAIQGAPGTHTTCGGRWLGEDVVDKMLSLVVKGTTTGVSDGVSAPAKAPTLTFPYLAAP